MMNALKAFLGRLLRAQIAFALAWKHRKPRVVVKTRYLLVPASDPRAERLRAAEEEGTEERRKARAFFDDLEGAQLGRLAGAQREAGVSPPRRNAHSKPRRNRILRSPKKPVARNGTVTRRKP